MTHRYALRFETGERRGEVVPLAGRTFRIGRRPGNSLQILENSVSGRHAEFSITDDGVTIKDLGSTNGTRVDGEKVTGETPVRHGSQVTLGHVATTFLDQEATLMVPASAAAEMPRGEKPAGFDIAVTQVHEIPTGSDLALTREKLERAKKGSRGILGLLGLLLLLGIAGGAFWWFKLRDAGAGGGATLRAVTPVAGNLFPDGFSFEDGAASWEASERATTEFGADPTAAYSGETGLGADLGPGEWAEHSSSSVRTVADRELTLGARIAVFGDATARLGVQFSVPGEDPNRPAPAVAWGPDIAANGAFEEVTFTTAVPRGYDRMRLVALAWSHASSADGGAVSIDDAYALQGAQREPLATFDETKLFGLGDPARGGVLFQVDHVLLSEAAFTRTGEGPAVLRQRSPITVSQDERGLTLSSAGADVFVARAEAALASGGLGTIADGGYTAHGVDFEREGVTDVVLGSGSDLVRLRFSSPARVRGRRDDGAFRVTAAGASEVLVQLRFLEERKQASTLAAGAENAERDGRLGAALQSWQELLDTYPYEKALVERAEESRGRLVRTGLESLQAIGQELERARFFRLVDLFRACRADAASVAETFAGSEVEVDALKTVETIDAELSGLDAELQSVELSRLSEILAVLEADGSARLAAEVRSYLAERQE